MGIQTTCSGTSASTNTTYCATTVNEWSAYSFKLFSIVVTTMHTLFKHGLVNSLESDPTIRQV